MSHHKYFHLSLQMHDIFFILTFSNIQLVHFKNGFIAFQNKLCQNKTLYYTVNFQLREGKIYVMDTAFNVCPESGANDIGIKAALRSFIKEICKDIPYVVTHLKQCNCIKLRLTPKCQTLLYPAFLYLIEIYYTHYLRYKPERQ